MASSLVIAANAQTVKVTGQVVDDKNEPVIGAYVKVKGSNKGAVTDIDGNYTIDADKNATLVVTYVGMAEQEIKVANRTLVNVVMKDNANDLNEVVVIGYGSVKRKDVTTAISSVSTKDLDSPEGFTLSVTPPLSC